MLATPWGRVGHGGVINLWSIFAVCTCRTSGTRSACWALRALLALRTNRADGASVALVTFLAFEVTACDAVLQLLQAICGFTGGGLGGFGRGFHLLEGLVPGCVHSLCGGGLIVTNGFQSVLFGGDGVRKGMSGLFGRCPSLLCCRLCIGLGLLCGGGIGVHGPHQLLPGRCARLRLCAVLRAAVGTDTIPQVCAGDGAGAI